MIRYPAMCSRACSGVRSRPDRPITAATSSSKSNARQPGGTGTSSWGPITGVGVGEVEGGGVVPGFRHSGAAVHAPAPAFDVFLEGDEVPDGRRAQRGVQPDVRQGDGVARPSPLGSGRRP
ncbi:hypothetical protein [Nonomuraea sp. NPDC049709]|uniref:hypothetical protein n=1 Tax=Nonomuraea sp. NPDC049709 TaxID=3154736 RepID=UPI00343C5475